MVELDAETINVAVSEAWLFLAANMVLWFQVRSGCP
jgi:hypothetical protein